MTSSPLEVDGRPGQVITHPYDHADPDIRMAYHIGHADGYRTGHGDGCHAGWRAADAHAEALHRQAAEVTESVARDLTSGRPVTREQRMAAYAAAAERLVAELGRPSTMSAGAA